jgi:predicted unusual protein kinase regulating ubiquinone biosynthesis (AarF/ABC1/UbiB family)
MCSLHFLKLSLVLLLKHKLIIQEIDYTKEAANAELFASNFKNMSYVKVPTIYWDYTTPQV